MAVVASVRITFGAQFSFKVMGDVGEGGMRVGGSRRVLFKVSKAREVRRYWSGLAVGAIKSTVWWEKRPYRLYMFLYPLDTVVEWLEMADFSFNTYKKMN